MINFREITKLFIPSAKNMHETVLGLDVGSYSVKGVVLSFKDKKPQFEEFIADHIGQSSLPDDMSNTIKVLCKRLKSNPRMVNVALKAHDAVIRCITFPRMKEDELRGALSFEIQKYIPYNINEAIFDSCVLAQLPDNKMSVLLVAVKKDNVQNFIKLIQKAGLEVNKLDIDAVAIANAFSLLNSTGTVAVVNIGAQTSILNIFKDNILYFTRDIELAGNHITTKIKDFLGLSYEDAEDLKCNPKERLAEVTEIVSPLIKDITVEIRTSFDYFEDQWSGAVSKVYISGGSAILAGIDKILSKDLEIDVQCWNPLYAVSIKPEISQEKLCSVAGGLSVATGLALKG